MALTFSHLHPIKIFNLRLRLKIKFTLDLIFQLNFLNFSKFELGKNKKKLEKIISWPWGGGKIWNKILLGLTTPKQNYHGII